MALTKQGEFTDKVTNLPDVPSPSFTATQIKNAIQQPSEELKITLNNAVDKLNSTVDGDSGANNIGATGFDGTASNPQAMLEDLNTRKAEKGADWTGTWQGFNPSQVDQTVRDQVNTNTSQLADIAINPKAYGAKFDGVTDDTASIQSAIDSLSKGGTLIFPQNQKVLINGIITIDPSQFITSLIIDLNGCEILKRGAGFAFDLKSNAWPVWNTLGNVLIKCNGAIFDGDDLASGAIQMTETIGNKVTDFKAQNFTTGYGVRLFVNDPTHWSEENIIEDAWVTNTLKGYATEVSDGSSDSSFNHSQFVNCKFNGKVNNSRGFIFNGNHARSVFDRCGGWINENNSTGGLMFTLNGWFDQAIMIAPWVDFGNAKDTTISFGSGYLSGTGDVDKRHVITITNANSDYFALPDNIYYDANVVSYNLNQTSQYYDEVNGTTTLRIPSDGMIKKAWGEKWVVGGTANTVYYFSRTIPPMKKILSVNISPYSKFQDNNTVIGAGEFGVADFTTDANGNITAVNFYRLTNGTTAAGCFYEIIGIPVF